MEAAAPFETLISSTDLRHFTDLYLRKQQFKNIPFAVILVSITTGLVMLFHTVVAFRDICHV